MEIDIAVEYLSAQLAVLMSIEGKTNFSLGRPVQAAVLSPIAYIH
jgi:hypothetical protein